MVYEEHKHNKRQLDINALMLKAEYILRIILEN
jgi:hypothetical protein